MSDTVFCTQSGDLTISTHTPFRHGVVIQLAAGCKAGYLNASEGDLERAIAFLQSVLDEQRKDALVEYVRKELKIK